ncbi:MAG: COG4315 family predicted lipoprotein [Candidatus Rokuibacteriota bacterium]
MVLRSTGVLVAGLLGVALVTLAGADGVPPPLKSNTVSGIGVVLTAPNGMTLYVYLNDREPGKSVCTGACEANWPPFRPAVDAPPTPPDPLAVITRLDKSKQYAYKGKPLYYCKTDRKPGDITGHKFRDFWLAAQP